MFFMRETIKPKLRFQVFARDEFTCQYCGRTPDQDEVVLHVDHTVSVKDGGTNDMENLITSCRDCNYGKGAKSILRRTKTEDDLVEELNIAKDRLEQIKALNKQRNNLKKVKDKISLQETVWARDITDDSLSDKLYKEIQKLKNKNTYTSGVITQALEIAYKKHLETSLETVPKFMAYLNGIARNISLSPEQQKIIHIYHKEIFTNERMYPQTRKMILEYSDFGIEFHEAVIRNIGKTLKNSHGSTFKTRTEVLNFFPKNKTMTVYKSGINLQVLVCDSIVMTSEDMFE